MNEVPVAVVAEKLEMFEMMADDIDDESNSQMLLKHSISEIYKRRKFEICVTLRRLVNVKCIS